MFSFFSRPFPFEISFKKSIRVSFFFAIFIFLFLLLFGPFGLANLPFKERFFGTAGYGILCFVILMMVFLTEKFLPGIFSEEKWTVGKEMLHSIIIFIVIGAANFFFSVWLGFASLSARAFFIYQFITLMVGALPYSILVMLKQNNLMKKYLLEAQTLNESINAHQKEDSKANLDIRGNKSGDGIRVLLESENKNDNLNVNAASILVISSADNYIEVYYYDYNQPKRKLLRSTLKKAEDTLKSHSIFLRCHKGYIVNTTKIKSVTGNAQGYKLHLENYEGIVPVSRMMNKALEEMIT